MCMSENHPVEKTLVLLITHSHSPVTLLTALGLPRANAQPVALTSVSTLGMRTPFQVTR